MLDDIAREIEQCALCKEGKTGKAVPGEGNPDASVVFLGEAPGREEAKTGRPFIGRSGKLLRTLIAEAGLDVDDVYITSPVKYLPLRGTPSQKDIAHGKTHLQKQLAIIRPSVIVLLGKTAGKAMLREDLPIMNIHGTTRSVDGVLYFITLHPAAAVRLQKNVPLIRSDFKALQSHIIP